MSVIYIKKYHFSLMLQLPKLSKNPLDDFGIIGSYKSKIDHQFTQVQW